MPSRGGGAAQARHHHEAATRALLAIFLTAPLAACDIAVSGPLPADEVPPIGFLESNADACDRGPRHAAPARARHGDPISSAGPGYGHSLGHGIVGGVRGTVW